MGSVQIVTVKQFLAFVAALFLLVRPLCDVQAAGVLHDARPGEVHAMAGHDVWRTAPGGEMPCCANLKDGAVVKLGQPAVTQLPADGNPVVVTAAWLIARNDARAAEVDVRFSSGAFFTPSSFYARSARIRR